MQTIDSARRAVELASEGLNWAPPRSRIRPWLVARLLLTRSRAQLELGDPDGALTDLEAALAWADRDRLTPGLLYAEIHLTQGMALLRSNRVERALPFLQKARAAASPLGIEGVDLMCDSLILEGDIAARLGGEGQQAPLVHYQQVFEVAARYGYPQETWPHLERAFSRLEADDAQSHQALMKAVDARRAELEVEQEQQRRTQTDALHRDQGISSVASGSVPGAAETVSQLHKVGFRRCYQQALSDNPEAGGSVRLTIAIGSEGEVKSVKETHAGLDSSVVSCVVEVAENARFSRPESTSAVVVVPVNFVKQRN